MVLPVAPHGLLLQPLSETNTHRHSLDADQGFGSKVWHRSCAKVGQIALIFLNRKIGIMYCEAADTNPTSQDRKKGPYVQSPDMTEDGGLTITI